MGTRNLICVFIDNEYKVAQYSQWDGYPKGQGVRILDFLNNNNLDDFKDKVRKCSWLTNEELVDRWSKYGVDITKEAFIDCTIGDKFDKEYPELSRDTGADIFNLILNSEEGLKLRNNYDFSKDSLFCEYAYVVDFDKNTFEVYTGFNNSPIDKSERFYTDDLEKCEEDENQYYPVKLFKSFSLNDLPNEETFLKICKEI